MPPLAPRPFSYYARLRYRLRMPIRKGYFIFLEGSPTYRQYSRRMSGELETVFPRWR